MACIITYIDPDTGHTHEFETKEEFDAFLRKDETTSEPIESLKQELSKLKLDELTQTVDNVKAIFRDVKDKLIDIKVLKRAANLTDDDISVSDSFNYLKTLSSAAAENALESAEVLIGTVQEYNVLLKTLARNMKTVLDNDMLPKDEKWKYIHNTYEFAKALKTINESINTFILKNLDVDNRLSPIVHNTLNAIDAIRERHDSFAIDFIADWLYDAFGENIKNGNAFNDKIKFLQGALDKADKRGNEKDKLKFAAAIEKLKGKKITKENIKEYMKGLKGDSNVLSYWLEAAIKSGDPIVSSFTKQIHDKIKQVRRRYIDEVINPLSKKFDEFTGYKGGRSNDQKEQNKGIWEWVPQYRINYDDPKNPKLIKDEVAFQFNKWWDYQYVNELIEREFNRDQARRDDNIPLYEQRSKELNDFKNKNSERQYTKEYYDIWDSLPEIAREKLQDLQNKIKTTEHNLLRRYSEEDELELTQYEIDIKRLYSFNDAMGNPKDEQGQKIAQALQDWSARKALLYDTPTDEDIKIAFENYEKHKQNFEIDLENKIKTKVITKKEAEFRRDNWRSKHTYLTFSKDYKARVKALYERLRLISKNEELSALYDERSKLTTPFRDSDGFVSGELYTEPDIKRIKELDEKIEEAKLSTLKNGVSKEDKIKQYKILKEKKETERFEDFIKRLENDGRNEEATFLKDTYRKSKEFVESMSNIDKENYDEVNAIYEELRSLQEKRDTPNYERIILKEQQLFLNSFYDKLKAEGTLNEHNEKFSSDREAIEKEEFEKSEWYIQNHIWTTKFNPDTREYELEQIPLSIWQRTFPLNQEDIINEYPKARYFPQSNVKDQYKNTKYARDFFTGQAMPKEGGAYDKRSPNYIGENKNYPTEPQVLAALNYLVSEYTKSQENIPSHQRNGLGWNIPAFEKKIADIVGEKGVMPLWDSVKRLVTPTAQDTDLGIGIDVTDDESNLFQFIPVKFKGKIDEKLMSYDVWGAVAKFSHHAMLREQYSEMLPKAKTLLGIVRSSKDVPSVETENKGLRHVISYFTEIKDRKNVRADHIEQTIRTVLFGEFEKASKDGVQWNKIVQTANQIASLNTLAWNIPGAAVNYVSGKVQLMIEAVSGEYFNTREYRKGQAQYYKYSNDFMKDFLHFQEGNKTTIGQMADYWGVLQGDFEENIGEGFRKTKVKEAFESFGMGMYLRKSGEHELQTSLWMTMLSKKTVLYNGEKMTLLDAYVKLKESKNELSIAGNEGIIKKAELENGKLVEKGDWTANDERDLMFLVQELNRDLNGNYAKINKSVAEKTALAKALFFFRKYLVPFMVRRYGGAKESRLSIAKDKYEEGYYITLYRAHIKLLFTNPRALFIYGQGNFKNLSPQEVKNLKRVYMELAVIAVGALFISMIGDTPEDLKDHEFATLHLLYLLKKVRSETESLNPIFGINEIMGVLRSPSIAFTQLGRYKDFVQHLGGNILGTEESYYKKDTGGFWEKGDSKALADALRLLGFNGKTFYPRELIEGFEYGQRSR